MVPTPHPLLIYLRPGDRRLEIHTSHNHPNREIQFCSSCKQEAVSKKMPLKSDEREFPLTSVLCPKNSQSLP